MSTYSKLEDSLGDPNLMKNTMYNNSETDFNYHLILGLKAGLLEGSLEIRRLKDKLFSYIMKSIEMKTKIGELNQSYSKTIANLQSEIESLKKDLQEKEDKNLNLTFKFDQLRAFSDEKIREVESLRSEHNKETKMSQKEEYSTKYRMLKRKLKIILKNRKSHPESKILQDITNVIEGEEEYQNSIGSSRPTSTNDVLHPFQNTFKVNGIQIQIQPLTSPALSIFSSIPSSGKSPAFSSLGDDTDTNIEVEPLPDPNDVCEQKYCEPKLSSKNLPDLLHFNDKLSDFPSLNMPKFDNMMDSILNRECEPRSQVLENIPKNTSIFEPVLEEEHNINEIQKDIIIDESPSLDTPCKLGKKVTIKKVPKTVAMFEKKPIKKEVTKKKGLIEELSVVERLYIDEKSLQNTVEELLLEITKPLKSIEEIEGLRRFYEELDKSYVDNSSTGKENNRIQRKSNTFKNLKPREDNFLKTDDQFVKPALPILSELSDLQDTESCRDVSTNMLEIGSIASLKSGDNEKKTNPQYNETTDTSSLHLSKGGDELTTRTKLSENKTESIATRYSVFSVLEAISNDLESKFQDQLIFEEFAKSLQTELSEDEKAENSGSPLNTSNSGYPVVTENTNPNDVREEHLPHICTVTQEDGPVKDSVNDIDHENIRIGSADDQKLECTHIISSVVQNIEDENQRISQSDGDSITCLTDVVMPYTSDAVESDNDDADEPKLVIVEDMEEPVRTEEDSRVEEEPTLLIDGEQSIDVNVHSAIGTSSNIPVDGPTPCVRYNLRQKSPRNWRFMDRGIPCRKKTIRTPKISSLPEKIAEVHKPSFTGQEICNTKALLSKTISNLSTAIVTVNEEDISSVLSERDINNLESEVGPMKSEQVSSTLQKDDVENFKEEENNESKLQLPKFYVESPMENRVENTLLQKSHFELVWSTIRYLNIDEAELSESADSVLVTCNDTVLRTAFEVEVKKKPNRVTNNEKVENLNIVKRYIEDFRRQRKICPVVAMTNFIANVRLTNRTTVTCAMEAVLLAMSNPKLAAKRKANVFNDLISMCLEIDHRAFEGFVESTKDYLKSKLFTMTYMLDENSNGQNMITCTIQQSRFYSVLNKTTRNVKDTVNLLYESLMSLKNRAHPIAYGILSQWPDLLHFAPHKGFLIEVMLFCLVHHKMKYNYEMYKTAEVQELIGRVYNIKLGEKTAEEYAKDAMMNVHDIYWVDAIALLCKRQMFAWSYRNVVMKYLVPILRIWRTDGVKDALLLKIIQALRRIMLACPYNREELSLYNIDMIVTALSDILTNRETSSRTVTENIYLAICELSSYKFSSCVELLSSWLPTDRKMDLKTLSDIREIISKKKNYRDWAALVGVQNMSKIAKRKKNRVVANKTNEVKKGIISVGLSRNARTSQEPPLIRPKKKKSKKNKKKKGKSEKS